jgi:hypothetical protein
VELSDRPWEGLPPELAVALRPLVPEIAADVVATVRENVSSYAADAPAVERLVLGVEHALSLFADLVERGGVEPVATDELYRSLGRAVHDEGRSLEALHNVFRIAARVAWRWMEVGAVDVRVPGDQLHVLA